MTRIAIDPTRPLGTIDRNVFGGFVEHLGRCVYSGLYEEGSPLSDERGFRGDVLGLLRELRMGVLRWPGGNFVSNYHWRDGIGPKGARPRRPELAWGGEESNRFGTDEFLAYRAELGAEPYICLNMGTGTLEEALAWVEYCNSAGNTHWANRRRENGREEPYRVRYWGLGNEMYGDWQVGALTVGLGLWSDRAVNSGNADLYPMLVIGGLVTIVPLIVLFLVLQRYWRGGMLLGSIAN